MRLRENSQCAKILHRLQERPGEMVEMPELVRVSGSYNVHSRIDELRAKHGVVIHNETDVTVRPHVSRYWVSPAAPAASRRDSTTPQTKQN
jgi:hypothetical protein